MPHSTYAASRIGSAVVEPTGPFPAGSFQSFTLTYTAGFFGIDDTGSIKIAHRFASDMGVPQFDDPKAPNFTTVEASNGAVLHVEYDKKRNIRPWGRVLYIKVVRGFLREGDQIVVRFGDRRQGSPGLRTQTFCEDTFELKVLVDAIATYDYVELERSPTIRIVPDAPVQYRLVLPTERGVEEPFRLCLKGEDRWGNPAPHAQTTRMSLRVGDGGPAIHGLPREVEFGADNPSVVMEGLRVAEPGDGFVELLVDGRVLARSNPLRITPGLRLRPFWADLHGQSEETIGTNSAREFFQFARDAAFLDAVSHQGNDFQITKEFWSHLNELTPEFNEDHRFIAFPGYEWSGNTGLGGDRNVLYLREGRPIHRSSHALVPDLSDVDTDANTATELFEKLAAEDCVVFAHIGGRYADIEYAHDGKNEVSIEIHSAWGSFDWLLEDAFRNGYRVGVVSNSDGHKGRPGASHPGATKFGSYGGLTCLLAESLTREALAESMRCRRHYGTTGCRTLLDVRASFERPCRRYRRDPNLDRDAVGELVELAQMGDICCSDLQTVSVRVNVHAASPLERIEIRNGCELVETIRPYAPSDLGTRIRVLWEGSEYRGRGRETIWDGFAELDGNNRFLSALPVNRYNLDKRFETVGERRVEWTSITTGGHAGFEATLASNDGTLRIRTAPVEAEVRLSDIDYDDRVFDAGGLGRRMRIFRLPDENPHRQISLERSVALRPTGDNPLYVRFVQEDGHVGWSSPIYVFQGDPCR
ncbi:MAG: DUF3604 domain-containing protein [Myxococcota bacterium]